MFTPVYDAVRLAEREILSARADAPVIDKPVRAPRASVTATRRIVSERLHSIAEAIAPRGELVDLVEPRYSPNQPTGC